MVSPTSSLSNTVFITGFEKCCSVDNNSFCELVNGDTLSFSDEASFRDLNSTCEEFDLADLNVC